MGNAPAPRSRDEAIAEYRLDHNLAGDHPFWTDERILAALELGME